MLAGFKEFIARGNAVDLAVGVIIGAAFSGVVDALVERVLSPLIGAIFGQPNFDAVGQFTVGFLGEPAVVSPGAVLTALFNFLLIAVALYFFVVVPLNRLAKKQDEDEGVEDDVSPEVALLTQIRDALTEPTSSGEHAKP